MVSQEMVSLFLIEYVTTISVFSLYTSIASGVPSNTQTKHPALIKIVNITPIIKPVKNIPLLDSFLNTLKNRSAYNFYTSINKDDKILTLSTCYNNDNERVVLHAKLIKKETK